MSQVPGAWTGAWCSMDKPTRDMGTNGGALRGDRRAENREHQHRMTTLTRTHPQTSKNHTHATDTICGHLFVFCFCLVCQNMRAYTPDRRMVLRRRSTTLFIRTPSSLCMAGWSLFHRAICWGPSLAFETETRYDLLMALFWL